MNHGVHNSASQSASETSLPSNMQSTVFTAILLFLPLVTKAAVFIPENGDRPDLKSYPVAEIVDMSSCRGIYLYNLTESQTNNYPAFSFWSSSFVNTFDNHDYMIVPHVVVAALRSSTYRASVLDITDRRGMASLNSCPMFPMCMRTTEISTLPFPITDSAVSNQMTALPCCELGAVFLGSNST